LSIRQPGRDRESLKLSHGCARGAFLYALSGPVCAHSARANVQAFLRKFPIGSSVTGLGSLHVASASPTIAWRWRSPMPSACRRKKIGIIRSFFGLGLLRGIVDNAEDRRSSRIRFRNHANLSETLLMQGDYAQTGRVLRAYLSYLRRLCWHGVRAWLAFVAGMNCGARDRTLTLHFRLEASPASAF
jgi:hypothetical protein